MTLLDEKEKLRTRLFDQLKQQARDDRTRRSEAAAERLKNYQPFKDGKVIMFYVATTKEMDTSGLIRDAFERGCVVTVPRVDRDTRTLHAVEIKNLVQDLTPDHYGILEPKKGDQNRIGIEKLDLVLVPGIAFDRQGNRLGRGQGYYDRFLKTLPKYVTRYGMAFEFQLVDAVPHNDSDEQVDYVVTHERLYNRS
jgi:5-formyltetrahydrofolate cyclo-ligase